jgi:UDP-N-acetylmuramate: L-alanyl-gamma-D-glutamyl-meso-diaminopimelate ligase
MQLFKDSSLTNIHFIGVCGTAMASVAADLKRSGFNVTGSDSGIYPPMSDFLKQQGVAIIDGFSPENIPDDALIVIGNSVSRGNPELEEAMNQGKCLISLPELISRRYLTGKRSIVITGTHGKTTTTAMVAHILKVLGRDPGWMLGGLPLDLDYPCWNGGGDEFVIEGDEYDTVWYDKRPKFYHYKPFIAVISSVEYDHSDIYPDIKAIEAVFERFSKLLPKNGTLVVCGDYSRALNVTKEALCERITYGFSDDADWQIRNSNELGMEGITGEFICPDGTKHVIELNMLGNHNLLNALAGIITTQSVGVSIADSIAALKSFRGVKRRLECLIDNDKVMLWEDFAHHPTAIKTTLEGLHKRYPNRRLWALLEPRSNTMVRNYHTTELINALGIADRVIIAPLHRADKIPAAERLDTWSMTSVLKSRGVEALTAESFDEILFNVKRNLQKGDVLVMMSNGGFGGIKETLIDIIKKMY